MRGVHYILAVGAASIITSAAVAADMPSIMPPPPAYYAPPPVIEDFGGWYLRGDIAQTATTGKLVVPPYTSISYEQIGHEFTGGTAFGIGAGYQFNGWFRFDVTGEYRSKVLFKGTDYATFAAGGGVLGYAGDSYYGGYKSWVGMINFYADLGTWYCVTPFVGVGIGGAYNTISGFSDIGTINTGGGTGSALYTAASAGKLDVAWAAYAGLAYKVSNNFTVELAYRYLDLGTAITGNGDNFQRTFNGTGRAFNFNNLVSQDIRLGVRWNLDAGSYAPPPPPLLVRKG